MAERCTYCFAGENEEIREKIAAGLGAFAQHCSIEEVRQMLAGPVAAPSGQPAARMGSALIIANTAQLAPQRQASMSISQACCRSMSRTMCCFCASFKRIHIMVHKYTGTPVIYLQDSGMDSGQRYHDISSSQDMQWCGTIKCRLLKIDTCGP